MSLSVWKAEGTGPHTLVSMASMADTVFCMSHCCQLNDATGPVLNSLTRHGCILQHMNDCYCYCLVKAPESPTMWSEPCFSAKQACICAVMALRLSGAVPAHNITQHMPTNSCSLHVDICPGSSSIVTATWHQKPTSDHWAQYACREPHQPLNASQQQAIWEAPHRPTVTDCQPAERGHLRPHNWPSSP